MRKERDCKFDIKIAFAFSTTLIYLAVRVNVGYREMERAVLDSFLLFFMAVFNELRVQECVED